MQETLENNWSVQPHQLKVDDFFYYQESGTKCEEVMPLEMIITSTGTLKTECIVAAGALTAPLLLRVFYSCLYQCKKLLFGDKMYCHFIIFAFLTTVLKSWKSENIDYPLP